jgi:hypothetical protein
MQSHNEYPHRTDNRAFRAKVYLIPAYATKGNVSAADNVKFELDNLT